MLTTMQTWMRASSFDEHQIVPLARLRSADYGDPLPTMIQHAVGSYSDAYLAATRKRHEPPRSEQAILVAVQGSYEDEWRTSNGAQRRSWSVNVFILDAITGRDGGSYSGYDALPDLGQLGPVTTDYAT